MSSETTPPGGTPAGSPSSGSPKVQIQEEVFYEGGPARGDLIVGLLLALTLVGLPIAVGSIVRALWLRFRITSRRIEVNGGWLGRDRSQVVYNQIREVRSVPRGFGAWGDMVLVLNDGSKLEMRSVPRFRAVESYIEERRKANSGKGGGKGIGADKAARGTPAQPSVQTKARPSSAFGDPNAESA
jgi:hypothetical protein